MQKPKLISFKLCPYVQRSVITLNEKKIEYEIEYIDLANKPEWFLKISPFGKVPVLQVGSEVLFESAVINEYLDEVTPPSLHPTDPLLKAKHRAWMEFASALIMDLYILTMTKDQSEYEKKNLELKAKLKQLESQLPTPLKDELYFAGEKFSLIDTAYAPFFMRLSFLKKAKPDLDPLSEFTKISVWSKTLLSRKSVETSVLPEVTTGYVSYIKANQSYLGALL